MASSRFLFRTVADGALKVPGVAEVADFADGEVLDVPGRPRVVHTPGHTAGHSALLVKERDVLLAGDALSLHDRVLGIEGPTVPHDVFNLDTGQAVRSLERFADLGVSTVLSGHGEPWHHGAREAVRIARERAVQRGHGG